jgi:hypothetical protein
MINSLVLIIILVVIVTILGIVIVSTQPKKFDYSYVGTNNCLKKVKPDNKNQKVYKSQSECQQNEQVTGGFIGVCEDGSNPVESKSDCTIVACLPSGVKDLDTGKTPTGRIGDSNVYLNEYTCWRDVMKKKWMCDVRGDGCIYVDCDPTDPRCFNSEEECLNKCKAVCSAINGCVQSVQCGDDQGTCFDSIKACAKECKNVQCGDTSSLKLLGTGRNAIPGTKQCLFSLCDPNDSQCRNADVKKVYEKCTKTTCAPYKCTNNRCQIADGTGVEGEAPCSPESDQGCYRGLEDCVSNCAGSKNIYKCQGNVCVPLYGTADQRAAECKYPNKCYSSFNDCAGSNNLCRDSSQSGFSCWDNCSGNTKCSFENINYPPNGGGVPVCFRNQTSCSKGCAQFQGNMAAFQNGQCIPLGNGGCDLVNDENCFQSMITCKTANNLG